MANFEVTTDQDIIDANDGVLSLREAIEQSNALNGRDTVTFANSVDRIVLAQGELRVTGSLDIDGSSSNGVTLDGDGKSRIFNFDNANYGSNQQARVKSIHITGGHSANGGGIYSRSFDLEISASTIADNSVTASYAGFGGGLAFRFGNLSVTNSTIANNQVTAGEGINGPFSGAGISVDRGDATISSSTITGNILTNNEEHPTMGGGVAVSSGTVEIENSIIAGNVSNLSPEENDIGLRDNAQSKGNNVIGQATIIGTPYTTDDDIDIEQPTDQFNVDAADVFGANTLADNGGPTPTVALLEDAANPALANANSNSPATDQRGVSRPQGSGTDIGAFESDFGAAVNLAPVITTTSTPSLVENTTRVLNIQSTDDNDSEGNGLTYSLTGGADQSLFRVNANNGVLNFRNAPDFENPVDDNSDNIYEVQVTVTDSGGLSGFQDLMVMVTDESSGVPGIPYTPVTAIPATVINGPRSGGFRASNNDDLIIAGSGGNIPVRGLNGDDVFVVGSGFDKYYGDAGNDTAIFAGNIGDYSGLNFNGSNIHVVTATNKDVGDGNKNRFVQFEFFEFKDAIMNARTGEVTFKDNNSPTPDPDPDPGPGAASLADLFPNLKLTGTPGNDDLRQNGREELIDALGGNDTQHGLGGNDFLIIGEGRDKNYGGTGIDVAVFDGEIAGFSGVSGIRDAYQITDTDTSDGDLGFDRVKAVELFAFDDALFDTRTGQSESFASEADLAARLEVLIASGDVIA